MSQELGLAGWRKQLKSGLAPNTETSTVAVHFAHSAEIFFTFVNLTVSMKKRCTVNTQGVGR